MKSKSEKATHIIPPRTVGDVGRAIFGAHWQVQLAKGLKVQDQTMRRWTNDGCPAAYAKNMRSLLNERVNEITSALKNLEGFEDEAA